MRFRPELLRSVTARALLGRFSKGAMISVAATVCAALTLHGIDQSSRAGKPVRPAVESTTPGLLTSIAVPNERPDHVDDGIAAAGRNTVVPATPAEVRTAKPKITPARAARVAEPPPANPPIDLLAAAKPAEAPAPGAPSGDNRSVLGSTFGLARSTAETATRTVLAWKDRAWTTTGSLLGGILR